MKPSFTDLTPEQQVSYGNGCGLSARLLNVPDFIFTASCRHHDFNYERGCGAKNWVQSVYKGVYYKCRADWDFFAHMLGDAQYNSHRVIYSVVSVVYFLSVLLNPIAWLVFSYGDWRTLDEIWQRDVMSKL